MMKKNSSRLLAALIASGILIAGCTPGKDEEVYPTPVAPTTTIVEDGLEEEPAEPATETTTPAVAPSYVKPAASIDTSALAAKPINGVTEADVEDILEITEDFALAGFDVSFLNGTWIERDIEDIASDFTPYVSPSVLAALESIDIKDPESANSLASVAALFTPSKKIKPTHICLDATVIEDCLYTDLVFSAPVLNTVDGQVLVDVSVSSTRHLLLEDSPAKSEVIIHHELYFKKDDTNKWVINGINNTFSYGKVEEL